MPGQSDKAGREVSVTAPTGLVRGLFRLRPWPARPPEPGTHGRIADGGGPESRLGARTRWSAGGGSGRRAALAACSGLTCATESSVHIPVRPHGGPAASPGRRGRGRRVR
jgi:hypothetical protein